MKILHCPGRNFSIGVWGSRFIFDTEGPQRQPNPQPDGEQEEDFETRATKRAKEKLASASAGLSGLLDAAGKKISDAGEAVADLGRDTAYLAKEGARKAGEIAGDVGSGVKGAGEAVVGIAAETPDTFRMYGRKAKKAGEAVAGIAAETPGTFRMYGRSAKSGAEAVVGAGDQYVFGPTVDALKTAGDFYERKAVAAFEAVLPLAEILVGLGIITKNKIVALGKDAGNFTAEKFMNAVDWAAFGGRYVKDGVVDVAKVTADLGKTAGVFLAEVAADSYEGAVAGGKRFVRQGKEFYDITTTAGKELAISAGRAAKGTAQETWRSISPAIEIVVGFGVIAKDKVVAMGTDIGSWSADKFSGAVDWTKFAARYVKNGVVDAGAVAYELGIKDPARFWGKVAANSYESAVATGKKFVIKGKDVVLVTADIAVHYARKAGRVVIGTSKEAWNSFQPGIEIIAGLGFLAKNQVVAWGGDLSRWTGEQWAVVTDKAAFAARYVKDGVVDMAKFAYEFNVGTPFDYWEKFAGRRIEDGKRFVIASGKVIDSYNQKGRQLLAAMDEQIKAELAEARARGQQALGTQPSETRVAEAPRAPLKGSISRLPEGFIPTRPVPQTEEGGFVAHPPEAPETADVVTYEVKRGDTMWKIASENYDLRGMSKQGKLDFALALQKEHAENGLRTLPDGTNSLIDIGEKIELPKLFKGKNRKE